MPIVGIVPVEPYPMPRLLLTFLVLSLCGLLLGSAVADERLCIAVPDIGAGSQPADGVLVDVIRAQRRLERAFAPLGVTVEWHFFKGAAPLINESFANGQLDVAYLGDLGAIVGRSAGLDTRMIAAVARGITHYLAVPPNSSIHDLAQLKGRRVGLFRGTAAELSFIEALRSAGLTPADVRLVNLDFAAASAALAAGQLDATWGGLNALALAERGLARLPVATSDLGGAGDLSGLLVVSGSLAAKHPDWVRTLVRVQHEAAAWASDPEHREAYLKLLAERTGYPATLLRQDLDRSVPLATRLSPDRDTGFRERLQDAINTALQARLIRRDIALDAWLIAALPPPTRTP